MEGRRRYRGDKYNQEATKVNRKSSGGDWQQTVPSWEKKFCTSICKVPWNRIVDAKKYMHCHDNVVNWDDTAAKEAFDNAKMRYYAETHGLPCEIEMPDPDEYIDEIDWDCRVDQDLLHDLVKKPVDVDTARKRENIVIFGDSFLQDQGFSSTGWGDLVEESKENPNIPSNIDGDKPWEQKVSQNDGPVEGNAWTDSGYNAWGWYDNNNTPMGGYGWGDGWGCSGPSGWGDGWNDSQGWYHYGNSNAQEYVEEDPNAIYGGSSYGEHPCKGSSYAEHPRKGGDTGNIDQGFCVPEHSGYLPPDSRYYNNNYMPRHEYSQFQGTNYQKNQSRRKADGARNRVNFVSEQQATNKWSASREKFTTSCAPVVSNVSGKRQNRWSMDKPVS
ncbi:hypothetical protein ACET3Z_023588 [Daucus carota]